MYTHTPLISALEQSERAVMPPIDTNPQVSAGDPLAADTTTEEELGRLPCTKPQGDRRSRSTSLQIVSNHVLVRPRSHIGHSDIERDSSRPPALDNDSEYDNGIPLLLSRNDLDVPVIKQADIGDRMPYNGTLLSLIHI